MAAADQFDPSFRFEAVPYQAEGGYTLHGLILALVLTMVGGLLAGALAGWIAQWFYLILLFPVGMAMLVGVCGAMGVHWGKVRSRSLCILIGSAGGCLAVATMHYFEFRTFLAELDKAVPGLKDALQFSLSAFTSFIDHSAEAGVQIAGRPGRQAINLGYYGSYIYWVVEILIVAVCAAAILVAAASSPFCAPCGSWKATRPLGRVNVPRELALQAITSGEIIRLAGHDIGAGPGRLSLEVSVCPNCGPSVPVDVCFKEVTVNDKGSESTSQIAHVTYPGEALKVLEALFEPGAQPAAAPATAPPAPIGGAPRERIVVKPADKKRKNETWRLELGADEAFLIDAQEQILARMQRSEASTRFVFPSFWQSVRNLGVLGDDGTVVWLQPDKAAVRAIKAYLKG